MRTTIYYCTCALLSLASLKLQAYYHVEMYGKAAYLGRTQSHNTDFITEASSSTGVSIQIGDFDHSFDLKPAFEVGVKYLSPKTDIKISYLWIRPWTVSYIERDPGSISFAYLPPNADGETDFSSADSAKAVYYSKLNSSLISLTNWITPQYGNYFAWGLLFNVRYMNMKENLEVSFTKQQNTSPYTVDIHSDIPALQIGTVINYHPLPSITWEVSSSIGGGFNVIDQNMQWLDINGTKLIGSSNRGGFAIPLVVDGAIQCIYHPSKMTHFALAYEGIYVQEVALAARQIAPSIKKRKPSRGGMMIIHGASARFSFIF